MGLPVDGREPCIRYAWSLVGHPCRHQASREVECGSYPRQEKEATHSRGYSAIIFLPLTANAVYHWNSVIMSSNCAHICTVLYKNNSQQANEGRFERNIVKRKIKKSCISVTQISKPQKPKQQMVSNTSRPLTRWLPT